MNVVCFGQQSWDYCWVTKQHLMSRLARRGHRVLYVEPEWSHIGRPLEFAQSLRGLRRWTGLREVGPRLYVYSIPYIPTLGWRWNYRRRPRAAATMARRLGFESAVAFANLPQRAVEMMRAVGPAARVYFVEDEWTAFGGYTAEDARKLRSEEDAILREVELALAISPRLVRRISQVQPRSYLLENAADVAHFCPANLERAPRHPEVARLPAPRLGFVGQIDERLDQELLLFLTRQRPDWQIVLAGRIKPGVDVSALQAEPNIHLLGYQPYERLPSVLRELDVCLVPYQLTELTQSCWPLKVMEYLATGKPVVTTPLESLLALGDELFLAATPNAFLEAIATALSDPAQGRERRLAIAAENSWEHRTEELEQRLNQALQLAQQPATRAARQSLEKAVPIV